MRTRPATVESSELALTPISPRSTFRGDGRSQLRLLDVVLDEELSTDCVDLWLDDRKNDVGRLGRSLVEGGIGHISDPGDRLGIGEISRVGE